jgi:hypothetical protein
VNKPRSWKQSPSPPKNGIFQDSGVLLESTRVNKSVPQSANVPDPRHANSLGMLPSSMKKGNRQDIFKVRWDTLVQNCVRMLSSSPALNAMLSFTRPATAAPLMDQDIHIISLLFDPYCILHNCPCCRSGTRRSPTPRCVSHSQKRPLMLAHSLP